MEKLLAVKEYDSITKSPAFKGDTKYKYLEKEVFQSLIEFIHEFAGDEENSDALEFMRIAYKRNVGDVVTIKNYVGLIQIKNGFQIEILPKISFSEGEDLGNKETKRIFLRMLRSMKDFPSKVFHEASLKADQMNLYELFINMYLQEVRQLVKRGIKSAYIQQQGNLRYYKGKILVSQHIKANVAHGERFYVAYDEFHPNRAENRLIKSTLLKLQQLTSNAQNAKLIRQLLTAFEMVEPSTNYQKDFSKTVIDRNTKDYAMLMQWSRVFLMNKSFTTFAGGHTSRALLFPMESVFESYVTQQMKRALTPYGWDVSSQDKGYYLFTEPRRQFALRPDIVCKKDGRIVIMDAKWKSLINNEWKNYGISQGDMYQMYAYSKKYGTSEIWLLYPLNEEMRGHSDIVFESGDGTSVRLYFVDVAHIEDSLRNLKNKLDEGNENDKIRNGM